MPTEELVDRRWEVTRRCGYGALLASVIGFTAWVYGLWTGAFLDLRPTGEYCTGGPLDSPATSWTWLPLSHRCHFADGTVLELVPAPVNLIVDVCLMVAICGGAVAIRAWAGRVPAEPGAGGVVQRAGG
ncbi:hypothetical protein [Herbidospora sp. RD11066]